MEDDRKTEEQLRSELTALRRRVAELEDGRLERNDLAKDFRESEAKYISIFEHAPVGIFRATVGGKIIEVNPENARILGYESPGDMIAVVNRTSAGEALYADPESRREMVRKALESNGRWIEAESRLRRKDGGTIDVRFFFRKLPGESGESGLVEGFMEDISARKRLEFLLRLQRDSAVALGFANSMDEAMERLLQSAMQIEEIEAGRVYLLDAQREELQLVCHAGLSPSFIEQVSCFGPGTPQVRLVMQGEPVYWSDVRAVLDVGPLLEQEGLASLTVIPIMVKGQVVAALNLASRNHKEVPESARSAIEAIAAGIGRIVGRFSTEEALMLERENLMEANAALKVLLRKRDEDRRELEYALLANVENMVRPYVDKVMRTRLTPDQTVFMGIIDSHLREITSPFLRTLSRRFADLTPMEMRVASLVREGKTNKEIAHILRISKNAVLFHRKNVRAKLGLTHKKANLESHLSSLTQ